MYDSHNFPLPCSLCMPWTRSCAESGWKRGEGRLAIIQLVNAPTKNIFWFSFVQARGLLSLFFMHARFIHERGLLCVQEFTLTLVIHTLTAVHHVHQGKTC